MSDAVSKTMGNRLAPPRFVMFVVLLALAAPAAYLFQPDRPRAFMAGFDVAALMFLLSCLSLLRVSEARTMREHAVRNDARRVVLLVFTGIVMAAILAAVTLEAGRGEGPLAPDVKGWIIATLLIAWLFSNTVYALHYAHLAYMRGQGDAGIDFPGTPEPVYSDFLYFAFTLGMTFQTSDVAVKDSGIRRTATFHCLAAFIFNIGVLAFTINVLGR